MNIQAEKIEITKMILDTNDPEILKAIKHILVHYDEPDFWDDLSNDEKNGIFQGLDDIENGRYEKYEKFIEKHR